MGVHVKHLIIVNVQMDYILRKMMMEFLLDPAVIILAILVIGKTVVFTIVLTIAKHVMLTIQIPDQKNTNYAQLAIQISSHLELFVYTIPVFPMFKVHHRLSVRV